MIKQKKKLIFYFEDDYEGVQDIVEALEEDNYEIILGAGRGLIETQREAPIDLVIIDLMIRHLGLDRKGNDVENIDFGGTNWDRAGVAFLRRIRQGKYEKFGFPNDVPVIIATAEVDQLVKEEFDELGFNAYFEKPFTIEDIGKAIEEVFKPVDKV